MSWQENRYANGRGNNTQTFLFILTVFLTIGMFWLMIHTKTNQEYPKTTYNTVMV